MHSVIPYDGSTVAPLGTHPDSQHQGVGFMVWGLEPTARHKFPQETEA